MFTVYVLYSRKHSKIYLGYTSDLTQRLLSHNFLSNKGYTARYRPWEVIYSEEFETKHEAIRREKMLKSGKGREFIWNLISEGKDG